MAKSQNVVRSTAASEPKNAAQARGGGMSKGIPKSRGAKGSDDLTDNERRRREAVLKETYLCPNCDYCAPVNRCLDTHIKTAARSDICKTSRYCEHCRRWFCHYNSEKSHWCIPRAGGQSTNPNLPKPGEQAGNTVTQIQSQSFSTTSRASETSFTMPNNDDPSRHFGDWRSHHDSYGEIANTAAYSDLSAPIAASNLELGIMEFPQESQSADHRQPYDSDKTSSASADGWYMGSPFSNASTPRIAFASYTTPSEKYGMVSPALSYADSPSRQNEATPPDRSDKSFFITFSDGSEFDIRDVDKYSTLPLLVDEEGRLVP